MQSQAEAEAVAYQNVLAEAERHMADGREPSGGKCWECDHFHEIQKSDELPNALARMLDFCGACVVDGCVTIVDRGEWHSWEECWEGH